jgi:hypothetical protein
VAELDWSDRLVQDMVDRNHVPREQWEFGKLVSVLCAECGASWPCDPREQLREFQAGAGVRWLAEVFGVEVPPDESSARPNQEGESG